MGEGLEPVELLPVRIDALPPELRERRGGVRLLADEPLVDGDESCVLQLREVAREVALREARHLQEEREVGVGDRGQDGEDRQAPRFVDEPINTFSIGYEPQDYSELSYAKQVADLIGANHHEFRLTAEAFFDAVPRLT